MTNEILLNEFNEKETMMNAIMNIKIKLIGYLPMEDRVDLSLKKSSSGRLRISLKKSSNESILLCSYNLRREQVTDINV